MKDDESDLKILLGDESPPEDKQSLSRSSSVKQVNSSSSNSTASFNAHWKPDSAQPATKATIDAVTNSVPTPKTERKKTKVDKKLEAFRKANAKAQTDALSQNVNGTVLVFLDKALVLLVEFFCDLCSLLALSSASV